MPRRPRDESLDAGARNWMAKTARKNLWRVYTWYDLDELIEDGVLCWQIVLRKYPKVRERRHLMSLFQRTYTNHIHRLATRRTLTGQTAEVPCEEIPAGESCSETELRHFACSAPGHLRELMLAFIDHPELTDRPTRRRLGGRRETTNEWLCGMIGLDPRLHDLDEPLRELLGGLKAKEV